MPAYFFNKKKKVCDQRNVQGCCRRQLSIHWQWPRLWSPPRTCWALRYCGLCTKSSRPSIMFRRFIHWLIFLGQSSPQRRTCPSSTTTWSFLVDTRTRSGTCTANMGPLSASTRTRCIVTTSTFPTIFMLWVAGSGISRSIKSTAQCKWFSRTSPHSTAPPSPKVSLTATIVLCIVLENPASALAIMTCTAPGGYPWPNSSRGP